MKQKSRLSIVLVTKYAHKFLDLCLKSYEKNSVYDDELIIICDQPSWQTLKLLQEKYVPYWLANYNHFFMACNFGAKKATREYVGFLNDDVYLGPRWDEAIEEIIAPDILACVRNITPIDGPNFGYDRALRDISRFDAHAFEDYCLNNSSDRLESFFWMPLVIKKSVFFDYGGFTYYNHHAHGHEIQLENRVKRDGGRVITSNKSFLFHFGNVGDHDKMPSPEHKFFYCGFFGCSLCGKIELNAGNLDGGSLIESIQTNGYWLCDECKNKAGELDILKLRHSHAMRSWGGV